MESTVRRFFERYESCFNGALKGEIGPDEVASLYASDFVSATPAGITSGKNDDSLRQAMTQGYAHYRAIGTRMMRVRDVRLSPIDQNHCLAHVAWTATYARADLPETAIDFEVHYLVQLLGEQPKVFGWISGDEQALLKQYGVV